MRKLGLILLSITVAGMANGCVASKKFVRGEVKTSSDTLNARIDKTDGEVGEVRDGVTRVDSKVKTLDGRVSDLDSRTNERFDGIKGDVSAVNSRAEQAQSSANSASTAVNALDEKFQNRNQFAVAASKVILFRFDSSRLDSRYASDLGDVASLAARDPNALIVLEGRTDSKGDQDYNVRLGERRVDAVKRYLTVEKNIPVYRIHNISFGSAKPVASNESREGREKNRAVVVTILTPSAAKIGNQ